MFFTRGLSRLRVRVPTATSLATRSCTPTAFYYQGRQSSTAAATEEDHAKSTRKKLREAPIDPRVYQHLQRLNLGWVGAKQKKMEARRKPAQAEPVVDPTQLEYFRRNRYLSSKRVLRKEKKRLMRDAANRARSGLPPAPAPRPAAGPSQAKSVPIEILGPPSPSSQALFESPVRRFCCAITPESLPTPVRAAPEVAIVGRSNVGKSTFLNALLGIRNARRAAAVGDRPGVTQSLDFYRLGGDEARLVVVDMPGYGFAFGEEKRVTTVQALTLYYLRHRGNPLKRVMLLLDARHGLKQQDRVFLQALYSPEMLEQEAVLLGLRPAEGQEDADVQGAEEEEEVEEGAGATGRDDVGSKGRLVVDPPVKPASPPKLQIVLTKCDLVARDDLAKRVGLLRRELDDTLPRDTHLPIMLVSAGKGLHGMGEVRGELAGLMMQQHGGTRDGSSSSSKPMVRERDDVEGAWARDGARGGERGERVVSRGEGRDGRAFEGGRGVSREDRARDGRVRATSMPSRWGSGSLRGAVRDNRRDGRPGVSRREGGLTREGERGRSRDRGMKDERERRHMPGRQGHAREEARADRKDRGSPQGSMGRRGEKKDREGRGASSTGRRAQPRSPERSRPFGARGRVSR